jgi:hypothetical protein
MKINNLLKIIVLMFVVGATTETYAQSSCKGFSRKYCKQPKDEFIPNPQTMDADMVVGESAETQMIFHKGHDYRIFVCAEETLGDVHFKIKTSTGDVLFDNQDYDMTTIWDFSMTSTKRLILEVGSEGEASDDGFTESGCVSILVGYKYTGQSGFRSNQ